MYFGTSPTWGSMGPVFVRDDIEFHPFFVWTDGGVGIHFQYMKDKPIVGEEEFRSELLNRLNQLKGVALPESAITKRPSIPLKILATGNNTERFLQIMDWLVGEWRRRAGEKSAEPGGAVQGVLS